MKIFLLLAIVMTMACSSQKTTPSANQVESEYYDPIAEIGDVE